MTPDQKRREAAETHSHRMTSGLSPKGALKRFILVKESFLSGCEYESKEAEARGFQRAVELLRSDEATEMDEAATPHGASPEWWAKWLEKQK